MFDPNSGQIVGWPYQLTESILTLDNGVIYASGDVLSDTAQLQNAVLRPGGTVNLRNIIVIDEDDQGAALDVLFFRANQSLGARNGAPNISDANSRDLLGFVSIVAGDYIDLGGARIACKTGLGLVLAAAAASRDLWMGTITRGTPTHTTNGLRIRLGLEP